MSFNPTMVRLLLRLPQKPKEFDGNRAFKVDDGETEH